MKSEAQKEYIKQYIEKALGLYGTYKAVADVAKIHPITVRKWREGQRSPRTGHWFHFKRMVDWDTKRNLRPRNPRVTKIC